MRVADYLVGQELKKFMESKDATLNQKLLLLEHTWLLKNIKEIFPLQKKQVTFLSILLSQNESNIKKALAKITDYKSDLTTKSNYEFLIKIFKHLQLDNLVEKTQNILESNSKKG